MLRPKSRAGLHASNEVSSTSELLKTRKRNRCRALFRVARSRPKRLVRKVGRRRRQSPRMGRRMARAKTRRARAARRIRNEPDWSPDVAPDFIGDPGVLGAAVKVCRDEAHWI